jgi:cytochrome oxidase Cu insertion factor (SCO1/SenC/PrrC family)
MENNISSKKKNPYTPWFVVIAFLAPVVAAYSFYFFGIKPPSYNNMGELISPIVDIESLALTNDNDEIIARDDITQRKWNMMVFAGANCDDVCSKVLHKIRQVNSAAAKNSYRLRRLIVHLDQVSPEFQALLDKKHPKARHAYGVRATIQSELKLNFEANNIYLIDPIGNIMMWFSADLPPKDILHDLEKLFKVSQIG